VCVFYTTLNHLLFHFIFSLSIIIYKGIIDKTIINFALKLEMDKYCETKLISKIDMYFESEGVVFLKSSIDYLEFVGACFLCIEELNHNSSIIHSQHGFIRELKFAFC